MRKLIALCCALLLTAACDGRSETPPDAADMQPQLTPGGGDLPPVVDPEQAANAAAIDVTLTEYAIELSQDSVRAGTVTFNIRNGGSEPHALRIFRADEEWETDPYAPGGQVSMSVALEPGTYTLHCPVSSGGTGHTQRGMQRTLRVY